MTILFGVCGFPLDDKKSEEFLSSMILLGCRVTMVWMRKGVKLHADEAKAAKWIAMMAQLLRLDRMTPGEASAVVGRLQYAASVLTDKCGRVYLRAFHVQIHVPMKGNRISPWLRHSMMWWSAFLKERMD